MKQKLILSLALFAASIMCMNAQVTIGSNADPHPAAVLDLVGNGSNGLHLPQVDLANANTYGLAGNSETAKGMVVFNTNADMLNGKGIGAYVWDGTKWSKVSSGSNVDVEITGLVISVPSTVYVGTRVKCGVGVVPADASLPNVIWEIVSGNEYATIDPNTGILAPLNVGTIVVKVTANDGSGVSATSQEVSILAATASGNYPRFLGTIPNGTMKPQANKSLDFKTIPGETWTYDEILGFFEPLGKDLEVWLDYTGTSGTSLGSLALPCNKIGMRLANPGELAHAATAGYGSFWPDIFYAFSYKNTVATNKRYAVTLQQNNAYFLASANEESYSYAGGPAGWYTRCVKEVQEVTSPSAAVSKTYPRLVGVIPNGIMKLKTNESLDISSLPGNTWDYEAILDLFEPTGKDLEVWLEYTGTSGTSLGNLTSPCTNKGMRLANPGELAHAVTAGYGSFWPDIFYAFSYKNTDATNKRYAVTLQQNNAYFLASANEESYSYAGGPAGYYTRCIKEVE